MKTSNTLYENRGIDSLKWYLRAKGSIKLKVVTGSMHPLIPAGTAIEVVEIKKISRFDIVVFWNGNKLICHYVWHINRIPSPDGTPIYITKNLFSGEDLPVPAKALFGKVKSHQMTLFMKIKAIFKGRR